MERRTADKRTRVANPEAVAAELAEHYARILGQQADRQVSDVIRTCLHRLASRLPIQGEDRHAVEELIARLLRLGEVGASDPIGSPRQIDDYIAGRLGEPACGPRSVYRALRAMVGHTVLVERRSRQIWVLRLSDLTNSSSKLHRALLAETPALYCLPTSDTDTAVTPPQPSEPLAADPSHQLRAEVARLQEELAAERLARAEADRHREAAEAAHEMEHRARGEADRRVQVAAARLTTLEHELGLLRGAIDEERARAEADRRGQVGAAQLTALEQELAVSRGREHMLADSLADARRELHGLRDAQAADAATIWRLIETDQPQEALTLLAARMHGLNVEDRILPIHRLMPAAAAVLLTPNYQSPQGEPTSSTPAISAAEPINGPALVTPQPSSLLRAPASPGRDETVAPRNGAPEAPADRARALAELQRVSGASAIPTVAEPPRTARAPRARPLASLAPILDARTEPQVKPSKVGRNDPCPCSSGKKFKRCCGQFA